jgi:hypothetical protein
MDNKLVVTHNAGFYSNCTIRLKRIIDFYNKNKIYPIVDSSQQWEFYKDSPGDITPYLFDSDEYEYPVIEKHIDFFESNEDQFLEFNKLDYKNISILVDKYFKPSKHIIEILNSLISKYNIDLEKTISVCYRGNDKQKETNLPSYDDMMQKIDEVKSKYPDNRILIQSDEIEFYNFVLSKYSDSIYFNEILKMQKNPNTAIQYHVSIGNRLNQSMIFHAILLIISKSSKVIVNSGNVGMWICFYRKKFDNVYQYLNHKEYIYGVYNNNYKKMESNWIQ